MTAQEFFSDKEYVATFDTLTKAQFIDKLLKEVCIGESRTFGEIFYNRFEADKERWYAENEVKEETSKHCPQCDSHNKPEEPYDILEVIRKGCAKKSVTITPSKLDYSVEEFLNELSSIISEVISKPQPKPRNLTVEEINARPEIVDACIDRPFGEALEILKTKVFPEESEEYCAKFLLGLKKEYNKRGN